MDRDDQRREATLTWNTLPADVRGELKATNRPIKLERGDRFEGSCGLVVSGIVGLCASQPNGRRMITQLFYANDLIDTTYGPARIGLDAIAMVTSSILPIDGQLLDQVAGRDAEFARYLLKQFRVQKGDLRGHCVDLAFKSPIERLASMLLSIRDRVHSQSAIRAEQLGEGTARGNALALESQEPPDQLSLMVRHSDLAEYIGVTPETLSRCLTKLRRNKLIDMRGRDDVRFLDIDGLMELAAGRSGLDVAD